MKPDTHNRPITNIDDALAALEQLVLFFAARGPSQWESRRDGNERVAYALRRIMNYARVL
jgi:hypothetical protein